MVLAGAGVEHKQLLSLAEPMLNDFRGGPGSPEPSSQYAGGDFRCAFWLGYVRMSRIEVVKESLYKLAAAEIKAKFHTLEISSHSRPALVAVLSSV